MTKQRALVIDDEPDIRELLAITLEQYALEVHQAASFSEAIAALEHYSYALCLTDMKLPDGSGLDIIELIQSKYPQLPVAMITAFGNTDIAVNALKKGAFDFITKPIALPRLRQLLDAALALAEPRPTTLSGQAGDLIGHSKAMAALREQIARLARSQAPVFIHGESGSGKEIVARNIHYASPRAEQPFIAVNCGAIPWELMESEFFGHRKGSFTGAHKDQEGLFQAADGGTLFLDEIADLPLSMQVKLLRGIQEKAVRPIGADTETPVDIRILSASHKNLSAEIQAGRFREDLYYRVNVIELNVPSLRERSEDIAELAEFLLKRLSGNGGISTPPLSEAALKELCAYKFPGNVRELENTLERALTLCDGTVINSADLQLKAPPEHGAKPALSAAQAKTLSTGQALESLPPTELPEGCNLDQHLADIEKRLLEQALRDSRWNKTAAAEKLGITFRQLRYKLKKLGID